ncbi:MAG: hypothetical protein HQ522_06405 [Bacteroidetes bacterium]|nr:hypothetical protein [Bacteroidota bacterium]
MATVAELTTDQFIKLLDDFHAEPAKRSKMEPEEIKELATRLNNKINVPIINETKEEKILIKIIFKIDNFLYDNLPNEFYDLVRSTDKGIDKREAKRLVRRLTRLANDKIDIPYIPEPMERIAFKFVIGMIVKAACKNLKLSTVLETSDNVVVTSSDNDIEEILED